MGGDRWIDPLVAEGHQECGPGSKLIDARREFAAESRSERVWMVARQQHITGLAKAGWSAAEPCTKLSETAAGQWAAAMWRRDEDDPAHLPHGLVEERLSEEPAVLGRTGDRIDGLLANRLPEA